METGAVPEQQKTDSIQQWGSARAANGARNKKMQLPGWQLHS
jgi:hypothetical protein